MRPPTYGQAATGDFIRMPFNRCNLGSEQGLIDDPVLGQGRDPLAPLQDVINDEGDIVVPVDPRYLGLWLTGLFGDPTSSDNGDGSFDHEFASGADALPSYTIEVGMPKVPAFFVHAGVKLNSIALEFTRSGAAAATISAIAQGETRFGTTQGGTRDGFYQAQLIRELAVRHIVSWTGVELEGGPAPPTPAGPAEMATCPAPEASPEPADGSAPIASTP